MSQPAVMTIKEQAEFVEYIAGRAMRAPGGHRVTEAWMLLLPAEMATLQSIAQRLHRMAPHEDRIRDLVTSR